jgi:hypothetical protein
MLTPRIRRSDNHGLRLVQAEEAFGRGRIEEPTVVAFGVGTTSRWSPALRLARDLHGEAAVGIVPLPSWPLVPCPQQ